MKQVIILRGLPGSGKSTFAKNLKVDFSNVYRTEIVSADDFFTIALTGEFKFDPTRIGDAHADCFRRYLQLLQTKIDRVIVDNTNTTRLEISPYVLAAEAFGYSHLIKYFPCSIEEASERNIHNVPIETIARMAMGFEQPLSHWNVQP